MFQISEKAWVKLTRWWIFSILFALIPFLFKILVVLSMKHHDEQPERGLLVFLFGQGELLLVSTSLCAVAIGEVFGITTDSIAKNLASGGALFLIAVASFYYAMVSTMGDKLTPPAIIIISAVIFFFSVITSSFCILLTETQEN